MDDVMAIDGELLMEEGEREEELCEKCHKPLDKSGMCPSYHFTQKSAHLFKR